MNTTPRFPTIVVATDLGPGGSEAIRRAHVLAPTRLVVCHVLPGAVSADPLFPQLHAAVAVRAAEARVGVEEQLHRQIAGATGRLPDDYEIICESGRPHSVIVRIAAEQGADLVVVGSVDHTGLAHRFLGGVAERVVRGAHCPVLVVRRPILHGAVVAGEGRRDAERHLDEALAREKITGERLVEVGIPEEVIVRITSELGADLAVVGTHGGGALSRFVLGSTAEAVLRDAPCSVLVVRLADAR